MRRTAVLAAVAVTGAAIAASPSLAARHPRQPVPVSITASPGHLQEVQQAVRTYRA